MERARTPRRMRSGAGRASSGGESFMRGGVGERREGELDSGMVELGEFRRQGSHSAPSPSRSRPPLTTEQLPTEQQAEERRIAPFFLPKRRKKWI